MNQAEEAQTLKGSLRMTTTSRESTGSMTYSTLPCSAYSVTSSAEQTHPSWSWRVNKGSY